MPRHARLVVPGLGLALAAGLSLTGPAATAQVAQDSTTHVKANDDRHDVRRLVYQESDPTKAHYVADRSRRLGDVTRVRVRYQAGAVVLRVRSAQLARPTGKNVFAAGFLVKTPTTPYTAIVETSASGGLVDLVTAHSGQEILCPGLHAHVGYHSGNASITVPVSCIGSPRWVRTKGFVEYLRYTHHFRTWADVAPGRSLRGGHPTHRVTAPVGTVTRTTTPRLLPGRSSLPTQLARTMRSLGFLGA